MAIAIEDIVDRESYLAWLEHQHDEVPSTLALRIALRMLPFIFSILSEDSPELTTNIARVWTLQDFRASFISWAVRSYPTHDIAVSARNAAESPHLLEATSVVSSIIISPNAQSAFTSARFATLYARESTENAVTFAAYNSADSSNILFDTSQIMQSGSSTPFASPLWPDTGHELLTPILHDNAQDQVSKFQKTKEFTALPWGLWIAWWENLQDDTSKSLFGEKADLEIALKPEEFWDRDVDVVMEELAEIVGWPWGPRKTASPFSYGWSSSGKVTLKGDAFSAIWVPQNRAPDDAANRLAAAKNAAETLITDLKSGMLQANTAYATGLNRYVDELPGDVTSSIYVADQELRTLRDDLEDDLKSGLATDRFARRLLRVIEAHYGLRPYYPDLLNFYDDVRDGRLTEPPPLEAIAAVEQLIRENTPDVFDESVSESLQRLEPDKVERPPQSDDAQIEAKDGADEQPITLPKDPIADIDPARAEQNAKSAALEKIDGVLSRAEKGAKNIERAEKVGKTFHKVGKPLWDFVKEWYESGGDVPPVG